MTDTPKVHKGEAARTAELVRKVASGGGVTLERGWAGSHELRVAAFVAREWGLPIRYGSGRRVPAAALRRGLLR